VNQTVCWLGEAGRAPHAADFDPRAYVKSRTEICSSTDGLRMSFSEAMTSLPLTATSKHAGILLDNHFPERTAMRSRMTNRGREYAGERADADSLEHPLPSGVGPSSWGSSINPSPWLLFRVRHLFSCELQGCKRKAIRRHSE
jgi:hypothetical protein